MHLDRKIILYEPGAITRDDEGNRSRGPATAKTVYAKRNARAGGEGISLETAYQTLPVEYTIRQSPAIESVDKDWWLEDNGQEYRIESTHESAVGRRQFIVIRAVART